MLTPDTTRARICPPKVRPIDRVRAREQLLAGKKRAAEMKADTDRLIERINRAMCLNPGSAL